MTPEQFLAQLLEVLKQMPVQQYTITGAADWPGIAAVGGIFFAVLGFMWRDLRSVIKENKAESKRDLEEHKTDNAAEHKALWSAMKDCQHDCCPRGKKE